MIKQLVSNIDQLQTNVQSPKKCFTRSSIMAHAGYVFVCLRDERGGRDEREEVTRKREGRGEWERRRERERWVEREKKRGREIRRGRGYEGTN